MFYLAEVSVNIIGMLLCSMISMLVVPLIFTSKLKSVYYGPINQALTKQLNPESGPRAVYREARQRATCVKADFHPSWIRTSFNQLSHWMQMLTDLLQVL